MDELHQVRYESNGPGTRSIKLCNYAENGQESNYPLDDVQTWTKRTYARLCELARNSFMRQPGCEITQPSLMFVHLSICVLMCVLYVGP